MFFEHTFREFVSKTIAAGLPNHQTQDPPIHFSVLVASPALIVFLGGGLVKIIWSYFCLPSSRCGTRLRTPLHIDPSIRDVLQARCPVLEDHGNLTAREGGPRGRLRDPRCILRKRLRRRLVLPSFPPALFPYQTVRSLEKQARKEVREKKGIILVNERDMFDRSERCSRSRQRPKPAQQKFWRRLGERGAGVQGRGVQERANDGGQTSHSETAAVGPKPKLLRAPATEL